MAGAALWSYFAHKQIQCLNEQAFGRRNIMFRACACLMTFFLRVLTGAFFIKGDPFLN